MTGRPPHECCTTVKTDTHCRCCPQLRTHGRQRRYFLLLRKPLAVQFAYDADSKQVLAHRISSACDPVNRQLLQLGDWLVRAGDLISEEGNWSEPVLEALLQLLESDTDTKVILERPATYHGERPAYIWCAAGRAGVCSSRDLGLQPMASKILVHLHDVMSATRLSSLQVTFCCTRSGQVRVSIGDHTLQLWETYTLFINYVFPLNTHSVNCILVSSYSATCLHPLDVAPHLRQGAAADLPLNVIMLVWQPRNPCKDPSSHSLFAAL
jgi:hypothetical protein